MSEFANQSIEKVTNFGIIKDMLNEQDERSPSTIEQIENIEARLLLLYFVDTALNNSSASRF